MRMGVCVCVYYTVQTCITGLIYASLSPAMQVRIWEIPEEGLRRNMTEAVLELYGHSRRVGLVEWHPTSSGILFSAGYDYKVPTHLPHSQPLHNPTHRGGNQTPEQG